MDPTSTPVAIPHSIEVRLLVGNAVTLFGSQAGWVLFAFIITQLYTYYKHSKNDSRSMKIMVYGLVLFQTAVTALDSVLSYRELVRDWGNIDGALGFGDSVLPVVNGIQPIEDSIPGIVVQCFFTWRLWQFSSLDALGGARFKISMKCISVFVLLVGLMAFCSSIGLVYGYFSVPTGTLVAPRWIFTILQAYLQLLLMIWVDKRLFWQVWTFSTAAADIAITTGMMAILSHAKSTSQFRETRNAISKIIRIALQTGLLTSVLALLVPIFVYALHSGVYTLPFFLLGKSYVISLLANLNARPRKKNIITDTNGNVGTGGPSHVSTIAFAPRQRHAEDNPNATITSHGISAFLRSLRTDGSQEHGISSRIQATDLEAQDQVDCMTASAAESFSESPATEK